MSRPPKILIVDGMNFLHRARAGFKMGSFPVVYNFIRSFRALVEEQAPTRVYFCLEGRPKHRLRALPSYKANRTEEVDVADPASIKRAEELESFFRQCGIVTELLATSFPVSVVMHPDFEADDVVYNLIKRSSRAIPWTVVSNDSDFVQLLDEFENVSVYNPMKKELVKKHDSGDYVLWKSLRGDGSDNVPGVSGVGDKTALELASDPDLFRTFCESSPDARDVIDRNISLIRLAEWTDEEAMKMTSSEPVRDWDAVRAKLEEWRFQSLLKDGVWSKLVETFDVLWGER